MDLIKKYGIFVFWFMLVLDCLLCIVDNKEIAEYRLYLNPLLMPVLALYFYTNTKRSKHPRTKALLYTGLFLCWAGDMALMLHDFQFASNSNVYLVAAIVLICLGLIVYTRIFRKMHKLNTKDCQEAFLTFLVMLVLNAFLYKALRLMNIGTYKYWIFLEMLIVTVFVAFAANIHRNKLRKNIAAKKLIPGAIVLSVAMYIILAHKFLLDDAGFLPGVVVLTFGFGNMLLVQGFKDYLKA